MKEIKVPDNEVDRLKSLEAHQLMDSLPEEVFDNITQLAAEIMGTPTAAINLIGANRQWHKSKFGLVLDEMPREYSFCTYAILNPDNLLVVPDARYDARFHDNPYVTGEPHIIFYAGVPITDTQGHALGALCVIDNRPRELPDFKLKSLRALGKLVNAHFALHKLNLDQHKQQEEKLKAQASLNVIDENTALLERTTLDAEQKQHLSTIRSEVIVLRQNILLV
jgi:GAF domain-containing protein